MSHSNSYDTAFQLRHTLNLYKKRFCDDDNLIIYPSSWYDGFFELLFRSKDDENAHLCIDYPILLEVINRFLCEGWVLASAHFTSGLFKSNVETPIKIQFERRVEE